MKRDNFQKVKFNVFDFFMHFFLIVVFISLIRGLLNNADTNVLKTESIFLFFYGFYFIYRNCLLEKDYIKIWHIILLITSLVSIQYILLAASEKSLSSFFITRIVTQQPHLAQVAVPVFAAFILFPNKIQLKFFAATGLLLSLIMVFISQQRGLWIGIVISVFLVITFYYFQNGISVRRIISFAAMNIAIFIFFTASVLLFDYYFTGSIILTLLSRVDSLLALSLDASTQIRLSEIYRALNEWTRNTGTIILGTGLGTTYPAIDPTRPYSFSVDNSYIFVLWKMGILGFAAFTGVILINIKHSLEAYIKTDNPIHKMWIAGLFSGFLGLLIIALTNASIVRYRFILIWSFLLATTEFYYHKILHNHFLYDKTDKKRNSYL